MEAKKKLLTYAGLKALEDELENLKVVKRREIAQKIKEAREQGDLSENAEYDAAKDEQRDIEARIEDIEKILKNLSKLGPGKIVLTGVYFEEEELGAATYDKRNDSTGYLFTKRIPGSYHGTGDVFASALLSGLLNNFSLSESEQIAVNFTADSIRRTYNAKTDHRFGVNFEQCIPDFLKELKLI